jgi:CAAX protease family protein
MSATHAAGGRSRTVKDSRLGFFLLAFVLAIPFWLLGATTGLELLPGLPVAALMVVCPVTAAAILTYREKGGVGVAALLKRSFDFRRIRAKAWYVPVLLLMPGVMALSFAAMRLAGVPVPAPQISLGPVLALCVVFFVGALGEELGWSGYAIDPMQDRWGAVPAAVALGLVWAVYHYVGLAQAHRSFEWVAWWSLGTVAVRVIMVWLYDNTGRSVFAVALFHMTQNTTWQLFPVHGSYFDPRITGSILALMAVGVSAVWGPRTLTRRGSC